MNKTLISHHMPSINNQKYPKSDLPNFTFVANNIDGEVYIGVAVCHNKDKKRFSKKVGRELAASRANAYMEPCEIYFGGDTWVKESCAMMFFDLLHLFIMRCGRYFKDAIIVYPSNIHVDSLTTAIKNVLPAPYVNR